MPKATLDTHHTYLLAYPRSGSNWFRYCFEYITKRQAYSREESWETGIEEHPRNQKTEAPTFLSHYHWGHEVYYGVDTCNRNIEYYPVRSGQVLPWVEDKNIKLILLLRDPKEAIPSHMLYIEPIHQFVPKMWRECHQGFVDWRETVVAYDYWPGRRQIVYYEDLIQNPYEALKKSVIDFASEDSGLTTEQMMKNLDELIENYDHHKQVCLGQYRVNAGTGASAEARDKLRHYANQCEKEDLVKFDENILDTLPPNILNLVSRYKESER